MKRVKAWFEEYGDTLGGLIACAIVVALIVGIVCILIARTNSHFGPADARFGLVDTPVAANVITDGKTGVMYLVLQDNGIAVTPLLSADGLPLMVDDLNHGDMNAALNAARANMEVE